MKQVVYINRVTQEKVQEKVPGGGMMRFLYGQNYIGKFLLWALIKRRLLSVLVGWYMISPLSAKSVPKFVKKNNIDLKDYLVPAGGYKHFNRFFFRKLKPGARPIGEGVVSPADGKLLVFPTIESSAEFYIKGEAFDLQKFLQSQELAEKYKAGAMAVVRLAPADYHRFHFPVSGYVSENKIIEGSYYSVSPLALQKRIRIFMQNKRHFVRVDSADYGQMIVAEIGATLTGSIFQSHWPNIEVEKGDEKGYFAFGGSTVVLLFEKEKVTFSHDLIENTKNGYETSIKMGETIGLKS